jgi:hypothetical protein
MRFGHSENGLISAEKVEVHEFAKEKSWSSSFRRRFEHGGTMAIENSIA